MGGQGGRLYTGPMTSAAGSARFLRLLGLATWLAAGASGWALLAQRPGELLSPRWATWLALSCLFAGSFWLSTSFLESGRHGRVCRLLLAAQTLAALGMALAAPSSLLGALLVVVAAQLAAVVGPAAAWGWVAAQTLGLCAIFVPALGVHRALALAAVFAAFEAFSLYTSELAARERRTSEELARVNRELMAAQSLLADRSRAAERLRISRDLHDVTGHHLTALSLALEAARHAPPGQTAELLARGQDLTRQLLQDVRRVVGALRDPEVEDLKRALQAVGEGIVRPQVHLAAPDVLRVGDGEAARAALSCVQEIVTNTIKHSDARHLWVEVATRVGGLAIRARDDGQGRSTINAGMGLRGMKERLEALGGKLHVASAAGHGFEVEAWIPLGGAAE
jgi:signal transduction histidine kinase